MHPTLPRAAAAIAVVSLACTSAAAQSLISQHGEVVIAVGDPVPGLPGVTINPTSNFDSPVIDQNGTMLFRARVTGGGAAATNDRVYLMGRNGADLAVALRSGDQAPGLPIGVLMQTASGAGPTNSPRISPFNEFLFFSSSLFDNNVTVTSANDTALFAGQTAGLAVIAREGDPVNVNGVTGAYTYGSQSFSYQNNVINSSGAVLFSTQLTGAPADQDGLMVSGGAGLLLKVVQEGDAMPDGSVVIPVSGTTMSFINQINESGQVLHELRFSTAVGTATTANDRALAVWSPGSGIAIVAREGQQAPGLPAGVLFATPSLGWTVDTGSAVFTASGNLAINAALDQGGVTTADDRAVYFGNASGLNLVVRKGDVTGLANDVRWGVVNTSSITCNDAGQLAFVSSLADGTVPGTVTTTSDSCIAFGSAGNVAPIAIEGGAVPGFPGYTFAQLSGGTNSPYLNARGVIVFQADITDGVNPSRRTLFTHDAAHGVRVMLDSVDTFNTSGGPATWFAPGAVQFGSGDGGPSHFNNSGDWAVRIGLNAPGVAAIIRGHAGSLQGSPSAISTANGGTQNLAVDVGSAAGNGLYVIIGSMSGTRPGFPSPLGPQLVPLNSDAWTGISLSLANTPTFQNSLWFTDAAGKNLAPVSITLPAGLTGLQGMTLHHAVIALDFNTLASTHVSEAVGLKLY